jgi:hypothetical protein
MLRAVGGTSQPSDVVGIQNDGAIDVQGVQGHADRTVADFNQVNGTGSISVDNGTVGFVGNVSAGETLRFLSDPVTHAGDNVLNLNMGKAAFGATIQGFGQGDRINLGMTLQQAHLFYNPNTGMLTADGGTVKLHFAGSYTASDFQIASNPDGTSAIVANPSASIPISDLIAAGSGAAQDLAPLPQVLPLAVQAGSMAADDGAIGGGSNTLASVLMAVLHTGTTGGAFHSAGAS